MCAVGRHVAVRVPPVSRGRPGRRTGRTELPVRERNAAQKRRRSSSTGRTVAADGRVGARVVRAVGQLRVDRVLHRARRVHAGLSEERVARERVAERVHVRRAAAGPDDRHVRDRRRRVVRAPPGLGGSDGHTKGNTTAPVRRRQWYTGILGRTDGTPPTPGENHEKSFFSAGFPPPFNRQQVLRTDN